MSRVGNKPVELKDGVTFSLEGQVAKIKGPKGELKEVLPIEVDVKLEDKLVVFSPKKDDNRSRAMWGLSRALVNNMVDGVTEGFSKNLIMNGVGYRAAVSGKVLTMNLGFSHDVIFNIPEGITITVEKNTDITVSGISKQLVGETAANIRKWRKPEPYKGKGVRYSDEYVRRKEGKKK